MGFKYTQIDENNADDNDKDNCEEHRNKAGLILLQFFHANAYFTDNVPQE
jgi:hypothetical protein